MAKQFLTSINLSNNSLLNGRIDARWASTPSGTTNPDGTGTAVAGQLSSYSGTLYVFDGSAWTALSTAGGTVSSVSGTTGSVDVANGTSTPVISLATAYGDSVNPYGSKTANYVLAAPNGSNGTPSFRAIVAADIPTLNQNTTGSAASLTTARKINGVDFDGTTAISVPTKYALGLTSGGNLTFSSGTTWDGLTSGITIGLDANPSVTTLTTTSDLTVGGNLTVNGTTTTVNSTTVTVDDKNLELGSVTSPTNTTADGGGITLKGSTDKTFNWVNSTAAWTSSEHLDLASGKAYYINGTSVLNGTTLGANVVNSSLTKVGALSAGTAGYVKVDASGNLTSVAETYTKKSTGAGAASSGTTIVVNHGYGQWVHAQLFETSTGNLVEVDVTNASTSGGTTTFTFASSVADRSAYTYVIIG